MKSHNRTLLRLGIPALLAGSLLATQCGPPELAAPPSTPEPAAPASQRTSLVGADGPFAATKLGDKVNTYAKLAANAKTGDTTVTVANAAALGLKAGDLILVIQMQGATIDSTANTVQYGSITNLNNAGLYEVAAVAAVNTTTNVITLDGCGGLKNNYSAAGHAQVVRVPQYTTLSVPAGTSITGDAWDGDKGGIVALYVSGKTTLAGSITATALGFRGGATDNTTSGPVAAFVNFASATAGDSAEHGEGVAGSSVEYDALTGRFGRGAPANGGGGGNAHNGGGGGGANGLNARAWTGQGVMLAPNNNFAKAWALDPGYIANANALTNSSGGGRGGYTYGSTDQDATTVAPATAAWGGDTRREVGGLGGRAIDASPATRVFFGGGGGAGDGNNNAAGAGGRGGGLVLLVTDTIEGTGSIAANGGPGERTVMGTSGNDAPGGGGGGGTILLSTTRRSSAITVSADGGVGGSQFITISPESEGPGGGGGGGVIASFVPVGTPTFSVAGGTSGTSDSTAVSEFNVNGATNGATGRLATFSVTNGAAPVVPAVCVPSDLVVTATHTKGIAQPGGTVEITTTITNSGPQPANAARVLDSITAGLGTINWTCTATGGATCPSQTGTGPITNVIDIPSKGSLTYVLSIPIPGGFSFGTAGIVYDTGADVPPGYNDPNLTNNSARVVLMQGFGPGADLSLNIASFPNPAPTNSPIAYTLVVTNRGPASASGASFVYDIPAGGTVQPITPPAGWTCQLQTSTVTCNYSGTVPPGALPPVQIVVTPPAGSTSVSASATVTGSGPIDPDTTNNTATSTTPVGDFPAADIVVGINSTPNPAMPGQNIDYTLRVINNGPSAATGAALHFDVPVGATLTNVTAPTGWQCQQRPTAVDCLYTGSFPTGALPDVLVTVTPLASATSLTATAQTLGQGVSDPNLGNNQTTEQTLIGNAPTADLAVQVTTSPDPALVDQPIVYNIQVNNNGPGAATGAVFTYDVPAGATIQSINAPTGWSCSQQSQQVQCWYSQGIDPSASTPAVQITIVPPAGARSIPTHVTTTPKGATDPSTDNNTSNTDTLLTLTKLSGGGFSFGCSAVPGAAEPSALSGALLMLLGLVGRRRLRRAR